MVCAHGDLRQVRDREHLVVLGDATQGVTDLQRDRAADADVHLVEDQCRHAVEARQDRLDCQHDAGEFSPRRDACEGSRRMPDVQRNRELDILGAVRSRIGQVAKLDREAPIRQPERWEQCLEFTSKLRRRVPPGSRQSRGLSRQRVARRPKVAVEMVVRVARIVEQRELTPRVLELRQRRLFVPAVLLDKPEDQVTPSLDQRQAFRI